MKTPMAKCDHCGVEITAVTHRVGCGYCSKCSCPGVSTREYYLPKTLRGPADPGAVAAELGRRENWRLLAHWVRVMERQEPGDELLQFSCEEPWGSSSIRTSHGVLWRRAGELRSVIVLDVDHESWRKVDDDAGVYDVEELKVTRFATAEEIAACAPVRDELRSGDRVVHYENMDIKSLPTHCPAGFFEQYWDYLLTEGRTGLLLIRDWKCVMRVRVERWPTPEYQPRREDCTPRVLA